MVIRDRPVLSCWADWQLGSLRALSAFTKKEKIMNAQELIEVIMGESLPNRGVKLKFHEMDYPFFFRDIFDQNPNVERERSYFDGKMLTLAFEYMREWINSHPEKDAEKNLRSLFDYKGSVDLLKAFNEIYDKLEYSTNISIPISNAYFQLKRFGTSLGLVLRNTGSSSDVHVKGTKILEALCYGESRSQTYMQEFIHSIECIIPIPRKDRENNSVEIDFDEVYARLVLSCPHMAWKSQTEVVKDLAEIAYMEPPEARATLTSSTKSGLMITGELVHRDCEGTEFKKTLQWRKGNVENMGQGKYRFFDGRDLCLSIQVECPFPKMSFLNKIPVDAEVGNMQRDLRLIGARLYVRLCAMMSEIEYCA